MSRFTKFHFPHVLARSLRHGPLAGLAILLLIMSVSSVDGSANFQATNAAPGDCNNDGSVSDTDFTPVVLEIFDGDGDEPGATPGGTFSGDPLGCNANEDSTVNAADLICTSLLVFNGEGACAPAGPSEPYDLGILPPELVINWPESPRIEQQVNVTSLDQIEDGTLRFDQPNSLLVIGLTLSNLTIAASDIEVQLEEGVRIESVVIERGLDRIQFSGGLYGRIELLPPADYNGPTVEYREEWLIEDVLFDGVQVDSVDDSGFKLRGRRIAVLSSHVYAYASPIWVGDTGPLVR